MLGCRCSDADALPRLPCRCGHNLCTRALFSDAKRADGTPGCLDKRAAHRDPSWVDVTRALEARDRGALPNVRRGLASRRKLCRRPSTSTGVGSFFGYVIYKNSCRGVLALASMMMIPVLLDSFLPVLLDSVVLWDSFRRTLSCQDPFPAHRCTTVCRKRRCMPAA